MPFTHYLKIVTLLILIVPLTCRDRHDIIAITETGPAPGEINQQMFSLKKEKRGIFARTDEDLDGDYEDYLWISGVSPEEKDNLIFFNEVRAGERIDRQLWYGPENRKLIEKNDLNEDGTLETITYYNYNAKPGVTLGIVARMEIDLNGDGKPDIWIYPPVRAEIDTDGNQKPDRLFDRESEVTALFNKFTTGASNNLSELSQRSRLLPVASSWAINPDTITEERYRSPIPRSY